MHAYSLRTALAHQDRWRRVAMIVWAVIAAITCGQALLIALPRHTGIYPLYAQAGQNWRAGEDLYADKDGFVVFRYSPLVAALFVPFQRPAGRCGVLRLEAAQPRDLRSRARVLGAAACRES